MRIRNFFAIIAILNLAFVPRAFSASPPSAKPAKAKPVDTTVRISSTPPGAMVLICEGENFRDENAVPLGKTPLLRLMPLTESGVSVRISKAGHQLWNGKLSSVSAEIKAEMVVLTDAEKHASGWFVSPPCQQFTVLPIRMGIKKIGADAKAFDTSNAATEFTNRFLGSLQVTLKARFSNHVSMASSAMPGDEIWKQLTNRVNGVLIPTIGFTPAPLRLDFTPEINASIGALDGGVLLVRAEAHYLGGGRLFARAVLPIVLSAGSAAAGFGAAQATGGSSYMYQIYGAPPMSDMIQVQLFLVHAKTRELMWYGQVVMPQYFQHEKVTENTAIKAAEQVPAAFLKVN
jgi:hypothetical protein